MANIRLSAETVVLSLAALTLGAALSWGYINWKDASRGFPPAITRQMDLLGSMRFNLAVAAEAERNAALSGTDEAQTFVNQAKTSVQDVDRDRKDLAAYVQASGTPKEREYLNQFTLAFIDYQRNHLELLGLAVTNSNSKAAALAFGPAAQCLAEFDQALAALADANLPSAQATDVLLFAFEARVNLLKIQALLAPHIAEAEGQSMTQLEAAMTVQERLARTAVENLAGMSPLEGADQLKTAREALARYSEFTRRIVALSRENSNVQSRALSLSGLRIASSACQSALTDLEKALQQHAAKPTR